MKKTRILLAIVVLLFVPSCDQAPGRALSYARALQGALDGARESIGLVGVSAAIVVKAEKSDCVESSPGTPMLPTLSLISVAMKYPTRSGAGPGAVPRFLFPAYYSVSRYGR